MLFDSDTADSGANNLIVKSNGSIVILAGLSPVSLNIPSVLNTNSDSLNGNILNIGSSLAPILRKFNNGTASGSFNLE